MKNGRKSKIGVKKLIKSVVGFRKPEFSSKPINKSGSTEIIQCIQIINDRTSLIKNEVVSTNGFDKSETWTENVTHKFRMVQIILTKGLKVSQLQALISFSAKIIKMKIWKALCCWNSANISWYTTYESIYA